jgi:hypothetical protein
MSTMFQRMRLRKHSSPRGMIRIEVMLKKVAE